MNRNEPLVSIMKTLLALPEEERLVIAEHPERFKKFASNLHAEIVRSTSAVAITDQEAARLLVQHKKYGEAKAESYSAKWRKMGNNHHGYNGPNAWRVREDFVFKVHAPLAGPCYRNLDYMQGEKWELKNDEPTKESLVYWIPRMAKAASRKTTKQMEEHRAKLRKRYELPPHHCQSFGSIAMLTALIFANYKRTKERAPLHDWYAISDTLFLDGSHLSAGIFGEEGLHFDPWNDEWHHEGFGFFLLGIEELKK